MNRGYVKIWRKIEDSGIIGNADLCQMLVFLMLKATHKERKVAVGTKIVTLKPGEFFTGRKQLALLLGSTERRVRTAIDALKTYGIIDQRATSYGSIISLINWDKYQCNRPASDQHNDQLSTNERPTSDQRATTKQALKHLSTEDIQEPPIPPKGDESGPKILSPVPSGGGAPDGEKESGYSEAFETAWKAYPRKDGKRKAYKAWEKALRRGMPVSDIVGHIQSRSLEADWVKENGRFVPHFATWINADGWLDEGARLIAPHDDDEEEVIYGLDFYGGDGPPPPHLNPYFTKGRS